MKLTKWISFLFITGLLVSCYPEKERTVSDLDLVGTRFSDEIDFSSYATYALTDSVIIVYDSTEDQPTYPAEQAALILSSIKANLNIYGWVEVAPGDTPDVFIEASTWNDKVVGAIYYPGYGYPGWGYPGYGWGYPSYGTSYYSYTTGTVMMHMMDVKTYPFDDSAPIIMWTGGLNGILTESTTNSRIEFSINQAFTQSTYLNKN